MSNPELVKSLLHAISRNQCLNLVVSPVSSILE